MNLRELAAAYRLGTDQPGAREVEYSAGTYHVDLSDNVDEQQRDDHHSDAHARHARHVARHALKRQKS